MRVPQNAKTVFSGEIFRVHQWKQRMFDGSFATFEMLSRSNSTLVIAKLGKRVVISKQQQPGGKPFVGLIGGRIEKNQTPLQNAKAELREEAGLASKKWKKIGEINMLHKIDYTIYVYVAYDCYVVGKQDLDSGEKIAIETVSVSKFLTMLDKRVFRESKALLELVESGLTPVAKRKLRRFIC